MNQNAFHDDDPRRFGRRPPDFTSRAIKLRLFMLMAALVVVLIAMKEVQRPERWEWMGFDREQEQPGVAATDSPADAMNEKGPVDGALPADPASGSDRGAAGRLAPGSRANEIGRANEPDDALWGKAWPQLDLAARRQLVRLIRRGLYTPDRPPLAPDEIEPLLDQLKQQCDRLERALLERMTLAPQGSDVRQALNQSLLDARDQCRRQSHSLRRAGTESSIDDGTRQELQRILAAVEPLAWADVVDHTPVRRAADGLAWILAWQKVLYGTDEESNGAEGRSAPGLRSVSVLQLMNQPAAYRGRRVRVAGWIRGVQVVDGPANELGIGRYHVAWLQTSGTETTPICIYLSEWPGALELANGPFAKVNLRVEMEGVFFKIRTYQATDGQWSSCPLVLARSFQVVAEPTKPSAGPPIEMPVWGWTLFLISMPVVAGVVAWTVYRWTRSHVPIGGRSVAESLAELERDASILSPRERVERLEQDAQRDSPE